MRLKSLLNKKSIFTVVLAIFCLLLHVMFPTRDHFQKVIVSLVFLLVLPVLYIKIVLKESLKNFGLKLGNWRQGVIWLLISFTASLLALYLIYNFAGFAEKYYLPQRIIESFGLFAFYEVLIVGFFVALYEFFFRGFVMFSFSEKLGLNAIILQFILFVLFLVIAKDFNWTFAPYLISAPFAGVIAYKSKSLIYSYLFSLLFVVISDAVYVNSLVN